MILYELKFEIKFKYISLSKITIIERLYVIINFPENAMKIDRRLELFKRISFCEIPLPIPIPNITILLSFYT